MPKDGPMVSVIIPAYDVDRYVRDAVGSMLSQTLEDIEVIAIDDGSHDLTGRILDEMAASDPRMRVMHVKNAGAPAARNLGLSMARGKYVYFADADDHANPTMLQSMVSAAEWDRLELVIAGFEIDTYVGNMLPKVLSKARRQPVMSDTFGCYLTETKTYGRRTWLSAKRFRAEAHSLFDLNLLYTPWNKLFLRSRIDEIGLRFMEDTFWDDFPFVLGYIRDVERVGMIPDVVYRFRRLRSESETSRWRDSYQKREEEHGWMVDLYTHWDLITNPAACEMIHRRYIERVVGCIESVCDPAAKLCRRERVDRIQKMTETGRTTNALIMAQPKSLMMRVMLVPMRLRNPQLVEIEGSLISFAKKKAPGGFALLKAAR